MSVFVVASCLKEPKTRESKLAAYLYAGLLTVFLLGQLFQFDQFMDLFGNIGFFGSEPFSKIAAAFLIVFELLAIPFLLGMRLSKAFRVLSMVLGWLAAFSWLAISLLLNLMPNSITNLGLLGTRIELFPGWWAVSFCSALVMLAAWSSWGLWPLKRKS